MRVALLTREYPPDVYGGAGVHVEHLAPALEAHVDVDVHAFARYEEWDALRDTALRVVSVDLAMAEGVAGADLVHSHTWYANLAGHLAKLLHGVPHVATTHSLEPLRPWKREQLGGGYEVSSWCERTGLEAADAVIAVSEQMRADVLEVYPAIDPGRVHVVHNGIDPEVYAPDPGRDVLDAHGIDPDRPRVVFVGRITRQKGLPHLLDAAHDLHPEALLVLLAGAPDTPEIADEVRGRVATLREERDVVWVEEMLPRPQVVQILTGAAAFVCPSVYEPFGLVNLEAMACEAPVVASAVGGIPEIVVEGETGFLVPPADPPALAAAIDRLVRDPDLARDLGRAGRERVLERFTWPAIAARTADLYRSLT